LLVLPTVFLSASVPPPLPPSADVAYEISKVAGKALTPGEITCLYENFSSEVGLISQRSYKGSLLKLYIRVTNLVKSSTKKSISHTGYYFDGPIPCAYGQSHTSLQFVKHCCRVLCAKIGPEDIISVEFEKSNLLHAQQRCITVLEATEHLMLPKDRSALICPYYPSSVAVFPHGDCDLPIVINVAMCTLASIKAFANVGLCHGDIKPANLMLTGDSQLVVLIDFGSAVPFGEIINGTSIHWGRDCPPTGSLRYDMTCLASVLYTLLYGALPDGGIAEMTASVAEKEGSVGGKIIADCLTRFDDNLLDIWTDWLEKVRGLSLDLLADFDAIWPVAK